jgi:hypothetical protein
MIPFSQTVSSFKNIFQIYKNNLNFFYSNATTSSTPAEVVCVSKTLMQFKTGTGIQTLPSQMNNWLLLVDGM